MVDPRDPEAMAKEFSIRARPPSMRPLPRHPTIMDHSLVQVSPPTLPAIRILFCLHIFPDFCGDATLCRCGCLQIGYRRLMATRRVMAAATKLLASAEVQPLLFVVQTQNPPTGPTPPRGRDSPVRRQLLPCVPARRDSAMSSGLCDRSPLATACALPPSPRTASPLAFWPPSARATDSSLFASVSARECFDRSRICTTPERRVFMIRCRVQSHAQDQHQAVPARRSLHTSTTAPAQSDTHALLITEMWLLCP